MNLCRNGLHDMNDARNVYTPPGTTKRVCQGCRRASVRRHRKNARAALRAMRTFERAA